MTLVSGPGTWLHVLKFLSSSVVTFKLPWCPPRTPMGSNVLRTISFGVIFVISYWFFQRIALWIGRIRAFKKQMPIIVTLFPPDSHYRRIWPKKWQTFHQDWNMQYKRTIYEKLGSEIFALVCLFEYDKVYFAEASAVLDLKIVQADRFPKDMLIFRKVSRHDR